MSDPLNVELVTLSHPEMLLLARAAKVAASKGDLFTAEERSLLRDLAGVLRLGATHKTRRPPKRASHFSSDGCLIDGPPGPGCGCQSCRSGR